MKNYKIHIRLFFSIIAFAFGILGICSCSKKTGMEKAVNITLIADTLTTPLATDTIPPLATDTVRTYLALGDSYTIGQSVSETERFPDQTVQLLKNENIKISNPDIIAVTGWTTANLINALNSNPPKSNYSVVSLLIGVNNQYQRRNIDEYKTEFTLLVNRSIVYAGNNKSHVFILSIPDYSVTPFARNSDTASISKEIDAFNSINKAISEASGVNYLDITSISREALNDPTLVAGDGLHPSGKQYKRWAELLAPLMKKF